ncbi:MAG: enoyl-CoA hydratase-related protein [Pseudomonadota bacterium]
MNEPDAPLLFELVEGHIALLRINRPQARNAIDPATAHALDAAVTRIERDPEIRVAVLASSTRGIFSAGGDVKTIAAGRTAEMRIGDAGFAGFVDAMRVKPWIAAVDGPALGGGCEICLACDMIVASPESSFGLPEVKLGMIAGAGGIHRIARLLPRNIALQMVATGAPIDGATAAHHGMANALVPGEDVIGAALALARQIAACAPIAVTEALGVTRLAQDRSDAELRRLSRERMRVVMATEDASEGARAFIEKRLPNWQGR